MAADYTSSVYSLVVIVSATLALSSYLLNHANSQMSSQKTRLKEDWKTQCGKLATGETSDDALQKEYDRIANQQPIGVEVYVAILVALLPISALLQALNVATKAWLTGGPPSDWFTSSLSAVEKSMPVTIILSYLVALVVVIRVMWRIWSFRNLNEDIKDSIDSLIQKGILAVSQYEKGRNGIAPQSKPAP